MQMVRPDGFEPPTNWFEASYSIQLSYGRARTGWSHDARGREMPVHARRDWS